MLNILSNFLISCDKFLSTIVYFIAKFITFINCIEHIDINNSVWNILNIASWVVRMFGKINFDG